MGMMIYLSMWVVCVVMSGELAAVQVEEVDALLQDYAYQAFLQPRSRTRTGVVYDALVPSNSSLSGIHISAIRLRSGSLRTRGVTRYKEFEIPKGVVVQPYVERLVFVYHNFANCSSSITYFPLPLGYTYFAPVLGLAAYDASDLMAKNLSQLHIRASSQPISIHFSGLLKPEPADGSVLKCVVFDLNGSVNLSHVLPGNVCTTFQQGHFSIVVEQRPVPSPSPSPSPSGDKNKNNNSRGVWIIIGSAVGGFALLVVLGLVGVWVRQYRHNNKMHQMERAAEVGESLHMTNVGSTRAPAATGTRTQPTLETEYVP